MQIDSDIYRKFYSKIYGKISNIRELNNSLPQYDVVHLHCDLGPTGEITDSTSAAIPAEDFLRSCTQANVKMLWIASDNPAKKYIAGFKVRGTRLNLVMTLERKNPSFGHFLERLLSLISAGDALPIAWNKLCPQIPGRDHPDTPETIMVVGRGSVRLLSE
jgi:hypothetical protein